MEAKNADPTFDWLPFCHGFRVEAQGRRIGVVEDVLYGAERRSPAALLIRGGLFGTSASLVPAEEVALILPQSKRLLLRTEEAEAAEAGRHVRE